MDWIEVQARTLAEAKELALDRLGVVEAELEFEVIDEPRPGLLGRLGGKQARIRARVKPVSREKPSDRRRRERSDRRRGERQRNGRDRAGADKAKAATPAAAAEAVPIGAGETREAGPGGTGAGRSRNRRRRSRGTGRSGPSDNGERQSATPPVEEEYVEASSVPLEEQADAAREFAEGLIGAFGVPAEVTAGVVDDDIEVKISGTELGLLVGPRGATLQAIEELTRAALQHAVSGHSARVHVDVGGYRERRRAALAAFATQIAEEVRASGQERALEPMTPPDRKVVHDTIAAIDGVATSSEGEEPRRRVVIRPE
jgi:spoIIIJ-associated protein